MHCKINKNYQKLIIKLFLLITINIFLYTYLTWIEGILIEEGINF